MMKIFITGEENIGWALDTDKKFAEIALGEIASLTKSSLGCDFVHSVSPLTTYKKYIHYNESFISVFPGEPKRLFTKDKNFFHFCVDKPCVAQSKQALYQLQEFGCRDVNYVPYIADVDNFFPINDKKSIRDKYSIPQKAFVICSFMRDSLGSNLFEPKMEKGPDLFVEIVEKLQEEIDNKEIIVLLAGPRRHWIKSQLSLRGIKYIYIGKDAYGDDIGENILSPMCVNELINASDMMLITSRSEGGPRGILEAGLAGLPIISTDVGIASDILPKEYIYYSKDEAVNIILNNLIKNKYSIEKKNEISERILGINSVNCVREYWKEFYFSKMQNKSHKRIFSYRDISIIKRIREII